MPRIFIGVPIEPTPELRHVTRRLELLGKSIRAVPRHQFHVTVKFLGEISEELIPRLQIVCGDIAPRFSATSVRLQGLGVFPDLARPQVVWCGFADAALLTSLAAQLETACESLGISRDRRAFHPHVTLARVKSKPPSELRTLVEEHEATDFGAAALSRFTLYRSELTPQGPNYTPIQEFRLPTASQI
jgi:RNA 2',3'-cyclic 3'-phosphodiesterase